MNKEIVNQKMIVGHIIGSYLELTQNWIYNQIRFQTMFPTIVLGIKSKNRAQFPYKDVFTLQKSLPLWRQFVERSVRKLFTGYYLYHYRQAQKHQVKLLHAHFGKAGLKSLPLAKALNLPLVTSFYGADMYLKQQGQVDFRSRYRPLFESGVLFLVEGPAAQQRLEAIGCPPEKIRVHRLGIDLEQLPYRPRHVEPNEPFRILMAATFTEKKGFPYGVEAFCQAAKKCDRLRLTIVGDARPDKPEELEIKLHLHDLVQKYKLSKQVEFRGYVPLDELNRLFYDHQIFLHPSVTAVTGDSEGGSPVVLTQAAASGMPIIATRHCDIPQIVLENKTGLLADERNVDQLRAALLTLVTNNELRLKMGKHGHEHAATYFSAQLQGVLLGDIYTAVLAEKSSRRFEDITYKASNVTFKS